VPEHRLNKALSLLVSVLLLAARPASAEPDAKALYQAHCARCHGETGVATVPHTRCSGHGRATSRPAIQISIDAALHATDPFDQEAIIRNGILRTSMPPFEKILSEEEIAALARYVIDLSKRSGVPAGTPVMRPTASMHLFRMQQRSREAKSYSSKIAVTLPWFDRHWNWSFGRWLKRQNGFWVSPADLTIRILMAAARRPQIFICGSRLYRTFADAGLFGSDPEEDARAIALYVRSLQKQASVREMTDRAAWKSVMPAATRGEYLRVR